MRKLIAAALVCIAVTVVIALPATAAPSTDGATVVRYAIECRNTEYLFVTIDYTTNGRKVRTNTLYTNDHAAFQQRLDAFGIVPTADEQAVISGCHV